MSFVPDLRTEKIYKTSFDLTPETTYFTHKQCPPAPQFKAKKMVPVREELSILKNKFQRKENMKE